MSKTLFVISVVSALFITNSTAGYLGIQQVVIAAMTPMMLYIGIQIYKGKIVWNANINRQASWLLFIGIVVILVKYVLGQDYFKFSLCFLIIPMLTSMAFEKLSNKKKYILRIILIVFFAIECLLAIYERIVMSCIFPDEQDVLLVSNIDDWSFRSHSLLGHPLANGMAVCVMLTFILSSELKVKYKVSLFFLGYISLFCFNARGATIVATIFFFPYLYRILKNDIKRMRIIIFAIVLLGIYQLYIVLTTTSLGGRLLNADELMDGSAQTRIDVFKFYTFIDLDVLLFGSPDAYAYVMKKLGAGGVENGLVSMIIDYGLVLTLLMMWSLVVFHWKKLKCYPLYERLFIFWVFYIIGMMNPNLKLPGLWMIWIFFYYAFRPIGHRRATIVSGINTK